jgi:hypothetical protein
MFQILLVEVKAAEELAVTQMKTNRVPKQYWNANCWDTGILNSE